MVEQGTPEWFQQRLGRVTASRIADVMARTKTGYGASRANYMAQLIVERLTGQPTESYTNAAMQWGIDTEPLAREAYEFMFDAKVELVGFVPHIYADAGASPDGLVGEDGLVEFKCPNSATHIETLLTGTILDKYIKQMQMQMDCTQRKWCDYVSFDPRMPPDLQLWRKRVEWDEKVIKAIREAIAEFLADMHEKLAQLDKLRT